MFVFWIVISCILFVYIELFNLIVNFIVVILQSATQISLCLVLGRGRSGYDIYTSVIHHSTLLFWLGSTSFPSKRGYSYAVSMIQREIRQHYVIITAGEHAFFAIFVDQSYVITHHYTIHLISRDTWPGYNEVWLVYCSNAYVCRRRAGNWG